MYFDYSRALNQYKTRLDIYNITSATGGDITYGTGIVIIGIATATFTYVTTITTTTTTTIIITTIIVIIVR